MDLQSRLGSLSFTNDAKVASVYAEEPNNRTLDAWAQAPRVTKVYLRIENPIVDTPDDPFIGMDVIEKALGRSEAIRIAKKFAESIENTNNWEERGLDCGYKTVADFLEKNPDRVGELYFDAFNYLDDAEEVAKLKAAGYDGAIHGGSGESADAVEYKVFSPNQVASAYSVTGQSDPSGSTSTGQGYSSGLMASSNSRSPARNSRRRSMVSSAMMRRAASRVG
jgi:hypothetical protein